MSVDVARDRSRDYVAFMECGAGDKWIPQVDAQLSSWLRKKGYDADLSQSGDHEFGSTRLVVRRSDEGRSSDLHFRLIEDGGKSGTWSTELVAHDEPGDRDWISLTVGNSEGNFVKVPALAGYLMDVLPLRDSQIEFSAQPQLFGVSDVERLVSLLADDRRHGLVFVAGSDVVSGISLTPYVKKVGEWARQVYGLAQVIVLDPAATASFRTNVGPNFEAPAWSIRTYQPGVRFDDWLDRRRHRILGTARLGSQSDAAIQYLLGDVARQQAATRPPDPSLVRVARRFARLENLRLVEQLESTAEATAVVDTIADLGSTGDLEVGGDHIAGLDASHASRLIEAENQVSLVKRVLNLKRITESALREMVATLTRRDVEREALAALQARVESLQAEKEQAEDDRRELLVALDEAQLEAEVARIDVDDRDDKVRWLEARLKEHNDFESTYSDVPDEFRPARPRDFSELLDRIEALPSITFTGDVSDVERLHQVDTNDAALRVAWDAVLAMDDYVRARRDGACSLGLDHYIHHTPTGFRTFPPGKFGETETGITMRQHGAERVFPVPTTIHATGYVTMRAHFKLARIGMATPRMYVLDGHPDHPMMYIGYLGTHLTNTQTK